MKSIDKYLFNYAAEQALALESMGLFDRKSWWSNSDLPSGVEMYSGATRMCFKLETLKGWVIKVDATDCKGYCKREADFYADSEEFGIQDCFATTYNLLTLDDGRVVLLQEEVTIDEDAVSKSFYDYVRDSEGLQDWLEDYGEESEESEEELSYRIYDYIADMDTRERLYAIFGDDKRFNVIDNFCYDNNINDLHEGNWGWTSEGRLVIIDFAGFGMI